jgi:hypothetical protein
MIVDLRIEEANGRAERTVALEMLADVVDGSRDVTLGADKNYDTCDFVRACGNLNVTPHVAKNEGDGRSSAIDDRTTRHPGYENQPAGAQASGGDLGWTKTVANVRRTRYREDAGQRWRRAWWGCLQPPEDFEAGAMGPLRGAGPPRAARPSQACAWSSIPSQPHRNSHISSQVQARPLFFNTLLAA